MARQTALKYEDKVFDVDAYLKAGSGISPSYTSSLGSAFRQRLHGGSPYIRDGVIDTVFADPPFNLGKEYGAKCDDLKPDEEYLAWCKRWVSERARTVSPGGALFL